MKTVIAHIFGRRLAGLATLAATTLLLGLCAGQAQAQAQAQTTPAKSIYASPEREGSVTEPLGDAYVPPRKVDPNLARVTFYRPTHGFAPGVAHLEINGHYLTSLQLGGYTEVCVDPTALKLSARLVQTGETLKNYNDATTTLPTRASDNIFIRVFEYGDGRATFTPVRPDVAQAELKDTRRQIHAASRFAQAKPCFENEAAPFVPASALDTLTGERNTPAAKDTIVLGSDALFAFDKSDISSLTPKGRSSLDELIAHYQKQYGNNPSAMFHVIGHADPLGNPATNHRLSEARAFAVRSYMVEKGISPKRITSEGLGSQQLAVSRCAPEATAESIACNKPNRRVVVNVETLSR